MTDARVRAFLAVSSDPAWVESARGLVEQLCRDLPDASWTRPPSWHLTVKFLGQVSRAALDRLAASIGPAAAETAPGEILAGGPVVFPPRGPARVLGVGFASTPALESLVRFAKEVDGCAKGVGVEEERRSFHPHVTLARLRHPWPDRAVESFRAQVDAWSFPPWSIRSCVLYESRLDRSGAIHTALVEWPFSEAPAGVQR
jgi:2'-5' RNA ligase